MGKTVYAIRELPPHQHTLSGQRYRKHLYHAACAAIWVSNLYFLVRVGLLVSAPQQEWQMWLLVLVEWIFARLCRRDQLLTVSTGKGPEATARKRLRLEDSTGELPLVDVLLPCCGEAVDVILDTVRAACTLDYPAARFRVLVLDDGESTALQDAVAELQSTWPQLSYHTRGKQSGRVFAKAGNLNYALFSLQEEAQPEYCVVLDADCLPMPHFLRATLPHLLQNPQAVLLTTRQYYYNLPPKDPLCQSRIYFYACENAEFDMQNVAIDAGSGALFRRQPIVDLGGYPTYSFSEDWQLSLVLQGLGYQTLQVEEMLQLGLVPTSIEGYIRQRDRWQLGHAQQLRALFPPANKTLSRSLQWQIAANGVQIVLGLVTNWIGFLAIPVLLLVSGPVIPETTPLLVTVQVVLAVCHMAMTWVHGWLQVAHTGFRVSLFAHLENSWLAATHLTAILRFFLISNKPKGSFVTGSSVNSWTNTSLFKACNSVLYPVLLFCAILGALAFSLVNIASRTGAPGTLTLLLTTVAWPPMLHVSYLALTNLWVPVAYLLCAPRYPERKSQLVEREKGVWFPSVEVQQALERQGVSCSGVVMVVPVVLVGVLGMAVLL